jgi:hypothetical protein
MRFYDFLNVYLFSFQLNLYNMKNLIFIALCLTQLTLAKAQDCTSGSSRHDIRGVNAMRAAFLNGGDMFWDLTDAQFGLEPRLGTAEKFRATIFSGGLWLGGKDQLGNLKLAASTYRRGTKFDYSPGPIQSGSVSSALCSKWDKHWFVSRDDINQHVSQVNNSGRITDTIENVFSWPGRNNPYFRRFNGFDLPQNQSFAPFFDKNKDGNYSPQLGDYPLPENVKPEAVPALMNWCIFNDRGAVHGASGGLAIGAEIQQTAWAYGGGSALGLIDSCIFTSHKVINKSAIQVDSFYIGLWLDFDLGCPNDDFVGSFPSSNTFYVYNRDSFDNIPCDFGINGFGLNPPVQAVTFLNKPLSKFMTTYNASSGSPNAGITDPTTAFEYYNLLNGRWKDGTPLTEGKLGYNPGATNTTNFAFSGVPNDSTKWSMFQENRRSALPILDIRSLGSTYIGTFKALDTARLDVVYSFHRNLNADNLQNIPIMIGGLPRIFNLYQTQFQAMSRAVGVEEKEDISNFKVYPNPSTNELWIETDNKTIEEVAIFNTFGQLMHSQKPNTSDKLSINVKELSSGIYFLTLKIDGQKVSKKIVIQH